MPSFQSVEKFVIPHSGITALIHHNINFLGGTWGKQTKCHVTFFKVLLVQIVLQHSNLALSYFGYNAKYFEPEVNIFL